MKHSKKMLSLFMVMIMTFSVFAFSITASAKDADGYTVVLLDISSSMLGSPLDSLKDVAKRFCASLLGADSVNRIAIVTYATNVQSNNFTDNYSELKGTIDEIENPEFESFWDRIRWSSSSGRGSTNIYDALTTAASLLNGVPSSAAKNIVLMTDGQPVAGATSEEGPYGTSDSNAQYANAIYNLMQEYKLSYNIYTVGFFHGSQNDLATRLLSDINNKGFYNAQDSDELTFMFANVADSVAKKTPKDYDFLNDSYNFTNYTSSSISQNYFRTIYESPSGVALYNIKKNDSSGGLCFGMAYTTASIYNGLPAVERWHWSKLIGQESASRIRDIHNQIDPNGVRVSSSVTMFNDNSTLLNDSYIKYAFIYQWSSEAVAQRNANRSDIAGLKQTIQSFVNNNRIGVVLCITHYDIDENGNPVTDGNGDYITSGHAVLAIGIDGKDILIDDPNNSGDFERLTVEDDLSWSYSGSWESDGVNSENSILTYTTDYYRPYQILLTGNKTSVADGIIDDNNSADYAESFVDGIEKIDADKTLITFTDSVSISGTDIIAPISSVDFSGLSDKQVGEHPVAYWVKDSDAISVNNEGNAGNEIQIAKDESLITAVISPSSDVTVENNNVTVDTNVGDPVTLKIETIDDLNDTGISVTGFSDGTTVSLIEKDSSYELTGLNNVEVSYIDNGSSMSSTTAGITDGRTVNITVDDENDTVSTDFVDETDTPETPTDPETPDPTPTEKDHTCKYCGQDHGTSFWGRFVGFFHKIMYFFAHIFGKM